MQLQVEDLIKVYADGTRALDGVSFDIGEGEGVVILGANGCGKSTLLRCALGLETVTAGTITLDGVDVARARSKSLAQLRRRMGSVFQQFNLVPSLSAFQNVLFGRVGRDGFWASCSITARAEVRERAMDCLARVGLATRARQRVDQLSGGQQQRVAIARMLMQEPEIVFADEPVASLDPRAGREVMDLLWNVVTERGITVVCVLHQLELARAYAGRIIGMQQGRVVLDAPPAALTEAELLNLYQGEASEQAPSPEDIHDRLDTARAAAV